MKISTRFFLYAVAFAAVVVTSASSEARVKTSKRCGTDYGYSKHDQLHRAFAVTGGRSPYSLGPQFSCGRAWAYGTKAEAAREAIRQCNVDKRRTGSAGICMIINAK